MDEVHGQYVKLASGYVGSLAATGAGTWFLLERVITVLSVISLLIGIVAGLVTLHNQWEIARDRKRKKKRVET